MTEASLAELQARVQLHDDERSIVRVLYRYAHALYAGERTDFLACWTEDAEFEHVRHGQRYVGQDQLGEFFDGVSHAPDAFHKHVVIEPMIEVSGDEAYVYSYNYRYYSRPEEPAPKGAKAKRATLPLPDCQVTKAG